MGDETLLVNSLMLIWSFIDGSGGKFGILKSINRHVKQLYHRFGITRDEIRSRLGYTFQRRQRHLKYNPDRAPLENYVAWFVYYELLTLMDECQRHLNKSRTIPLSELHNGKKISRIGGSIDPYERQGADGLANYNSPEDEYIGKELMQMALDFFGEDDLEVLLGARERIDEAERLGINYYTYCKRLTRKVHRFRSRLQTTGYFD